MINIDGMKLTALILSGKIKVFFSVLVEYMSVGFYLFCLSFMTQQKTGRCSDYRERLIFRINNRAEIPVWKQSRHG